MPRAAALERAKALEEVGAKASLPLYGVPFAVKDNFDVEGLVLLTAGCPRICLSAVGYSDRGDAVDRCRRHSHRQNQHGPVRDRSGGGTRTPYGACSSVFDENYIGRFVVRFRCGSGEKSGGILRPGHGQRPARGRVPAAFNNLVGLKPSKGLLSTSGVFPACRSLDCVSIFAHSCLDAHTVFSAARGFDAGDAWSRAPKSYQEAVAWSAQRFRFGVPPADQLKFFGDEAAKTLFEAGNVAPGSLGRRSGSGLHALQFSRRIAVFRAVGCGARGCARGVSDGTARSH